MTPKSASQSCRVPRVPPQRIRPPPDTVPGPETVMLWAPCRAIEDVSPRVKSMWSQIGELTSPFGYGNLLSTVTPADVAAVYPPATYDRLAAVKARVDPENVFRGNHNIPPASG